MLQSPPMKTRTSPTLCITLWLCLLLAACSVESTLITGDFDHAAWVGVDYQDNNQGNSADDTEEPLPSKAFRWNIEFPDCRGIATNLLTSKSLRTTLSIRAPPLARA